MFTPTEIQLNRILYLLRRSERVFVVGHISPDGDAIGSMLAIKIALEKLGKEVKLALEDDIPSHLSFLPQAFAIEKLAESYKLIPGFDLLVAVDCAAFDRTGLEKYFITPEVHPKFVNIDHHQDNPEFGSLNFIRPETSSTSEILYDLLLRLGILIDAEIATCLLNGIFFDTNSFQNANTTTETLKITSKLLSSGASLKQVTRYNLKNKSLRALKLWGRVLSRVKRNCKFGTVSTVVTRKDLNELNASTDDLEGIANFLNSIPDSKISIVLTEKEEGKIKGSLRTLRDDIDVSRFAALFGGGGHPRAAGFMIPGRLEETAAGWRIIG